jgi:hypothetical protein
MATMRITLSVALLSDQLEGESRQQYLQRLRDEARRRVRGALACDNRLRDVVVSTVHVKRVR